MVDAVNEYRRSMGASTTYALLVLDIRNRCRSVGRYEAEAHATRAQVHDTRTAVLWAGRIMMITVRGRMGEMALPGQVHGVLDEFTHTGYECPEEQRCEPECREAFHPCQR